MVKDGFFGNISFWSALFAWVFAQSIKMGATYRRTRHLDFSVLVSTGGMPSAHSAMVSALATSVGLRAGFGSALFAVVLAFALVVMFDAQSVRRAAGQQARKLNQIVEELFQHHHLSQQKLAEFLGHTRTEVFAGMVTGVAVALLIHGTWG
ncbi:MAG: divergent PAP2 family protein [Kiritimatiellia bacterium]|nr:divergent PAP2 family protein [Kiritimatiellia bacterium]